jgi:hypothetical protein
MQVGPTIKTCVCRTIIGIKKSMSFITSRKGRFVALFAKTLKVVAMLQNPNMKFR